MSQSSASFQAVQRPPLTKSFEPKEFEAPLYRFWEESRCFDASDNSAPNQKAFAIMIPPPNVTGALHMGHGLTNTIQDILTRWRRMKGENALWLPGTDHAGIATQTQVEKAVAKEGKGPSGRPLSRHDLGRKKFLERTWQWKEEHGGKIVHQLRKMGSSLDWRRERFTMDPGFSKAVREVFVDLYQEGLIYRGERIINWCPRCQTALSDLEVIPTDRKGKLWKIKYPIVDAKGVALKDSDGHPVFGVVATTRPETLLGDTAICVHPDDERYQSFHGMRAQLPLLGRLIPVIVDAYVDPAFGTGVLKITPAHDFNDHELGKKHQLPLISVMGKEGKITDAGGPYAGLKFAEARTKILQDLTDQELLVGEEEHPQKVGQCQRCDCVVEPLMSKQWFVKIQPLADPAIEAVRSKKIQFYPASWEKTYFEWMLNIRDWCISRQLWWGHQIPAWYCGQCNEITVAKQDPKACAHCGAGAEALVQDEDVLDTWFSSSLWPFATLGWPEKTDALKTFYPNAILETGFDILFFWVARMMMMGIHFMKEIPFSRVYLHAMVRDEKGEKMSKTRGNVIDPLDLIERYGADPMRFTLAIMAGQGRDVKLSVDRIEGYRAFCNKVWNAVRFFHFQLEADGGKLDLPAEGLEQWIGNHRSSLAVEHRWLLSRLQDTIRTVEQGLDRFELNESAQAIYDFTWNEFCDWAIEFSKILMRGNSAPGESVTGPRTAEHQQTLWVLRYVVEQILTLLHPFTPFFTEELWLSLPGVEAQQTETRKQLGLPPCKTLMLCPYPKEKSAWKDVAAEAEVKSLQAVVLAVRNFRGENNLSPKKEFDLYFQVTDVARGGQALMGTHQAMVKNLCKLQAILPIGQNPALASDPLISKLPLPEYGIELWIPLKGLVDLEGESQRLKKELEKVVSDIVHIEKKFGNPDFMARAPEVLVQKEQAKLKDLLAKKQELESAFQKFSKA